MRWVITGAGGMLATDVRRTLLEAGAPVLELSREQLDITDAVAAHDLLRQGDVVVNCAAYTAVDAAEEDEAAAFAVNAVGPARLAAACTRLGARLLHVSTDYVFRGTADEPYEEDAPVAPRSAYGRTKAAGEWAVLAAGPQHLVARTAWLYGAEGPCFPRTIARLARERGSLDVVDDQVGQPTWTRDLARVLVALGTSDAPGGIVHATAAGSTSWCGFARRVVESAGLPVESVRAVTSEAFPRPAPRPAYSVLGSRGLRSRGIEPIGGWEQRWERAADEVLAGPHAG